jgi:hypothetical protein
MLPGVMKERALKKRPGIRKILSMTGVDDTERNAVYRKNGDGTGVPWVILSIEVAAQAEQDSFQSARVTSFGKIVPPPASSVAQVISEQEMGCFRSGN